ncbi:acyl-CoA carboxylase subunit beta [Oceanibacterium hippocampi]|uniref:Methylmalonyl-CoA carboxyltransferase 12S subunit n=1 Tax=Oceanibacterium hippocampi TaxID=745714 RepID=A0A1Y5RZP5_9PROT|nr:carboxyl transferase domain-containing protein [Oceanibacterium hippocampi]SLN29343.1 Methylmalonyl-CoA carboxyltransferase 12S subunit [Oceanibacterium hippocampi]
MAEFESTIDTGSEAFRANRAEMLDWIARFRALEQKVRDISNGKKATFEKRGKLLPRERLALLLDPDSPFLEFSTLAGLAMHDDDGKENVFGGGLIAGIGRVAGTRCLIVASDSAIKGGTVAPMGLRKSLRAQEIARLNKLPVVNLVESGGANLLYQAEIFVDGGRGFCSQARLSAAGIPQVTVVHGSSTAGGAYQPGLSDYTVMVRGKAKVFLAGPPLLKAATGEIASDEELGGAEMHATVSGVADFIAEDDADGIRLAREIVGRLGWDAGKAAADAPDFAEPRYDPEELLGFVPVDYRKPYDVREVVARVVDGSDFLDFKAGYGPGTVCLQAAIHGLPCAIIGNNGPIDARGAAKAAQFIQLMCQSGTPIVYLQNTTGYMVGTEAEQSGIVKHGSKMIQAVANATVPQITLHIGASFGAGHYGMCGRAYDPRFVFAWPNNRIAVMGGQQAARVMSIVTEEKMARAGQQADPAFLEAMEAKIVERMDGESTALYATARLWDDGIIDPRNSRTVLGYCLAVCRDAERRQLNANTFGVARM